MAVTGEQRIEAAAKGNDKWIGGQKIWVAHEVEHRDQIPGFCILKVG